MKHRELKLGETILPTDVVWGNGLTVEKSANLSEEQIGAMLEGMAYEWRPVPARLWHSPYSRKDKDFYSHGIRRAAP